MTATDWVQIIGAVFTGFAVVANILVTAWLKRDVAETKENVTDIKMDAEKTATDQNKQLAIIHDNGNAHLALITEKLAAAEAHNQKLIDDAKAQSAQIVIETATRFEKLESLLAEQLRQKQAEAPAMVPPGSLGSSEFVQKIEIQQPQDKPVPVKETL